jgi:hypothetical protein
MDHKLDFSPTGFTNFFQKLIEIDLKRNERATSMLVWYLVVLTAIQGFLIKNISNNKIIIIIYCIISILIVVYRLIEYLSTNTFTELSYLFHFQLMEMKSRGQFAEFENPDFLVQKSSHFSFNSLKKEIQNGGFLEQETQIIFQKKYRLVERFTNWLEALMIIISVLFVIYLIFMGFLLF